MDAAILSDFPWRRIRDYVRRMTRDPHAADDIAQETFIKASTTKAELKNPRRRISWFFAIARNVAIDWIRGRQALPRALACCEVREPEDPYDVAALDDQRDSVRSLVRQLPDDQAQVILLRYWEGLTYEEIAAVVDCSVGNARVRAHRARETLRELALA